MKKKTIKMYRVGFFFDDGTAPNWIVCTSNPDSVPALVDEVTEEYGEVPTVKVERVKL